MSPGARRDVSPSTLRLPRTRLTEGAVPVPTDPEDVLARARAARRDARRLEELVVAMQVQTVIARAEHLLIEHSPLVERALRRLLEDGEALPEQS